MSWDAFCRFCHDFRLVPNIFTRADSRSLWAHNVIIQRHLKGRSLYTAHSTSTGVAGRDDGGIDAKQFMWMLVRTIRERLMH
jgi:hypothetical protein